MCWISYTRSTELDHKILMGPRTQCSFGKVIVCRSCLRTISFVGFKTFIKSVTHYKG